MSRRWRRKKKEETRFPSPTNVRAAFGQQLSRFASRETQARGSLGCEQLCCDSIWPRSAQPRFTYPIFLRRPRSRHRSCSVRSWCRLVRLFPPHCRVRSAWRCASVLKAPGRPTPSGLRPLIVEQPTASEDREVRHYDCFSPPFNSVTGAYI